MSIYKYIPFAYTVRNKFSDRPVMQMNSYSLSKLLLQFNSIKSNNFYIQLTDHGVPGALIIFRQGN